MTQVLRRKTSSLRNHAGRGSGDVVVTVALLTLIVAILGVRYVANRQLGAAAQAGSVARCTWWLWFGPTPMPATRKV